MYVVPGIENVCNNLYYYSITECITQQTYKGNTFIALMLFYIHVLGIIRIVINPFFTNPSLTVSSYLIASSIHCWCVVMGPIPVHNRRSCNFKSFHNSFFITSLIFSSATVPLLSCFMSFIYSKEIFYLLQCPLMDYLFKVLIRAQTCNKNNIHNPVV